MGPTVPPLPRRDSGYLGTRVVGGWDVYRRESRAGEEHRDCLGEVARLRERKNGPAAHGREPGAYSPALAEVPPGSCRGGDRVFVGDV